MIRSCFEHIGKVFLPLFAYFGERKGLRGQVHLSSANSWAHNPFRPSPLKVLCLLFFSSTAFLLAWYGWFGIALSDLKNGSELSSEQSQFWKKTTYAAPFAYYATLLAVLIFWLVDCILLFRSEDKLMPKEPGIPGFDEAPTAKAKLDLIVRGGFSEESEEEKAERLKRKRSRESIQANKKRLLLISLGLALLFPVIAFSAFIALDARWIRYDKDDGLYFFDRFGESILVTIPALVIAVVAIAIVRRPGTEAAQ